MKRKIALNMATSLLLELVSLVCAFILPRLIITQFGSEYNGIVTSVTQFLSFVTLLRAGIGGVTRAALYKPLVDGDRQKISEICKATDRFMKRVAVIFIGLLIVFAALYPFVVRESFDWFFSFSLVLILGLSTFTQYYFGITYQMLLQADQRLYVYSLLQIVATILNTVLSVVLINGGVEFRMMKLVSATVFGMIPIVLNIYVRKKYAIQKDVEPDNGAISQRWDAFTHQLAAFVHGNTDIVVLTVFSNLFEVSVYSIYFMIVNGIKKFVLVLSSGIESAFGEIIAKQQYDKLNKGVATYEWVVHVVSTVAFTGTYILLPPFIKLYTSGVTDANYDRVVFGGLLCLAIFLSCIRLPYESIINAAGKFKETKASAIIEAVVNIGISIVLARKYGCSGVAIGTIVAMLYRTIYYGVYSSKTLLSRSIGVLIKRIVISVLCICIVLGAVYSLHIDVLLLRHITNYLQWAIDAIFVVGAVGVITLLLNILFYRQLFCSSVLSQISQKLKIKIKS